MKKQLTSLDLFYLVKELQELVGARIQKIHQITDRIYIDIYTDKKQTLLLAPNYTALSEYKKEFPKNPPGFCMVLRKYLANKRITAIRQHDFERILEIETTDKKLIVELFSKGNIILVDKETGMIIHLLRAQRWSTREVLPKREYAYPPACTNTPKLSKEEVLKLLKESDKNLVRTLATKLSFGGTYAEEILFIADIQKDYTAQELSATALTRIYNTIQKIFKNELKPTKYAKKELVAPFQLQKIETMGKQGQTFSKTIDEFFATPIIIRGQHDTLKSRLDEQKKSLVTLKQNILSFKKQGDALSQEQNFEAAEKSYSKYKKSKSKIDGLKEAIQKTELELKKTPVVVQEPEKKEIVKKEWYEKFRWFKTSDGFLVIGGKDATTNEIIVKKHADKDDIVFHAQIIGAPFCVIKADEKKKATKTAIEETAQFAASYSKAWQQGLGTVDVFWVTPEQLSKEKGLAKGAFMVHGKHNYIHNVVLELAFGLDKNKKIIHGPLKMVEKITKRFIRVTPGRMKAGELAKKIRHKLKYEGSIDDIQRFIPSGKGSLK